MTDGCGISCEIARKWMSLDLIEDKSTLVQVMAWCRQATSHYLSQCWPRSMSLYGISRPQWVNIKIPSYQHRDSHYKGKTVSPPSYLNNGTPNTWKDHPYKAHPLFYLWLCLAACNIMSTMIQHFLVILNSLTVPLGDFSKILDN